jgi:hypothetical protein
MERTLPSGGVLWRMLGAWADLRGSMRAELDREPSEGRLLFFAMFAGLIWFLGQAAVLAYGPLAPTLTDDEFTGRVAWEFITSALFVPLFYYVLAAIGGALPDRLKCSARPPSPGPPCIASPRRMVSPAPGRFWQRWWGWLPAWPAASTCLADFDQIPLSLRVYWCRFAWCER